MSPLILSPLIILPNPAACHAVTLVEAEARALSVPSVNSVVKILETNNRSSKQKIPTLESLDVTLSSFIREPVHFEMNDLEQIIAGGYCIGCGACSLATDGYVPVSMDEFGQFQADISSVRDLEPHALHRALLACPFSNEGPNEDSIGEVLYRTQCEYDHSIGFYSDLEIGHVSEEPFREIGTSGGIITWLLSELLRLRRIDAVIHVKKVESSNDGVLFRYGISWTVEEVRAGAKSRYYPVEMSEVLQQIKHTPGRYAVVGVPCFIKAVRRCAEQDPVIKDRVAFCIGLVCGHLKSKAFGDCFAWQAGIPPGQLEEIDFRVKLPNCPAGDYGVYLRGGRKEVTRPTRGFLGSNWGLNFFRYSACDFCDDVFAECADIAIGDAWLPEYSHETLGNSVVVVRNQDLSNVIEIAQKEGRLNLSPSDAVQIAASQAGGLRDRREGLAYRLYLKTVGNQWVPTKRVNPNGKAVSSHRAKTYAVRSKSGEASHQVWKDAVAQKDFAHFAECMDPFIRRYQKLYRSFWRRSATLFERTVLCAFGGSAKWRM